MTIQQKCLKFIIGAILISGFVYSQDDVTVPNTFVAGTKATSSTVNENFDSLEIGTNRLIDSLQRYYSQWSQFGDTTIDTAVIIYLRDSLRTGGDLNVEDNVIVGQDLTVTRDLIVSVDGIITEDLSVGIDLTVDSNALIYGTLESRDTTTLRSVLYVDTIEEYSNPVILLNDDVTIGYDLTVVDDIAVLDDISCSDKIIAQGDVEAWKTLSSDTIEAYSNSSILLNDSVEVAGYLSVDDSVVVGGYLSVNDSVGIGVAVPTSNLHSETTEDGNASVARLRNLSAGTSAGTMLSIANDSHLNAGTLIMYGSNNSSFPNELSITNQLQSSLTFGTNGTTRVTIDSSGNMTLAKDLVVNGSVSVTNNLTATDTFTTDGPVINTEESVSLSSNTFSAAGKSKFIALSAELSATDTLWTITGGVNGQELIIHIGNNYDIVILNSYTTNGIDHDPDDNSFTLNSVFDSIHLIYFGSEQRWICVSKQDNSY
jgi:hypothetical protein